MAVTNGDFETGDTTGWYGYNGEGSPDATVVATSPHSGTYCLKIQV